MIKFEIEYIIRSSPSILFNYLSNSDGLSEWFADTVNVSGDTYTFIWDGSEEKATLLYNKKDECIRFKWQHIDDDNAYFEFRLKKADISGELALIVTDFCEDESEKDDAINLWNSQIEDLMRTIGC